MKNIYTITLTFLYITNICSVAQLSAQPTFVDDFSDGELSSSPPWTGSVNQFIINSSHQLQLNNTVAATSSLTTPFAPTGSNTEWSMYVRQAFAGSANNYSRIYLLSDQPNLTQPLQGYYLQLGEAGSNDAVELFRQSGTTVTSVCRGPNGSIAAAFAIRIKVTRDAAGVWKLLIDYTGGLEYKEEASGLDASHASGSYFGFTCVYTAGNANRFYFDDLYGGPPKAPPVPPEPATFNDVVIHEFFADPSPVIELPSQEFVELYNRSSKAFTLQGWKLGDATSLATIPDVTIEPGEYIILTTPSGVLDYSIFGKSIGVSSFPSLNNSGDAIRLVDGSGRRIDSLSYTIEWYQDMSRSDGGYTIERLNPDISSTDVTNWYVSQSASGGTPGKVNSVFGRNPDSKPPVIKSIIASAEAVITIRFSELMKPESVSNLANYSLDGIGSVSGAHFNPADSSAIVTLANIVNGSDYRIIVQNLEDLAGNMALPKELSFTYFVAHPVERKDLLIHEIMADPSPTVQLPDAEYIEVFNRSMHPIRLTGWTLEDATAKAKLGATIIHPGKYLVITSSTNISRFSPSSSVVGVLNFPSLGNSGDVIMLRDDGGAIIDSVSYDIGWYHNSEKSEGGWSLELIDISNPCGESDNWTASESISGGTPGFANSVNGNKPDLTPPVPIEVRPIDKQTLLLRFNEKLSSNAAIGTVTIDPGDMTGRLTFSDRTKRVLQCTLEGSLSLNTEYRVSVSDVSDCNGNLMLPAEFSIAIPQDAESGDVVINEVLFNPRPTGVDFVELYNRTSKYIDLNGWTIAGAAEESAKVITRSELLKPYSYLVITTSILMTQSNYPASADMSAFEMQLPSMPDDQGTVVIRRGGGLIIDQFTYSDGMHSQILDDTEGVSLERITADIATDQATNWHSASGSAGYATPGFTNSSSRTDMDVSASAIQVVPEIIDRSLAPFVQIFYSFDEPGLIANVRVTDLEGRVVRSLASNETIASRGFFQWDGDREEGGPARTGYYVIWFQVFGLDGTVSTYRRRVVVGLY